MIRIRVGIACSLRNSRGLIEMIINTGTGRNHTITLNVTHQLRDTLVLRALQSGKRFVSTISSETKLTRKQVIASLDRLARQNLVTVEWIWRAK
jgi:hypothetical protein